MDSISALVARAQKEAKNSARYKRVRDLTMLHFYRYPSMIHILKKEYCGEFLLYCEPRIDTYITQWRPVLNYKAYIEQIIIRRVKGFRIECYRKLQKREDTLSLCRFSTLTEPLPEEKDDTRFHILPMDLVPPLFKRMARARDRALPELLKRITIRKGVLLMLASIPHITLRRWVDEAADILIVDVVDLGNFLATAETLLSPINITRHEIDEKIAWRFFLADANRNALKRCTDPEKAIRYKRIIANHNRTLNSLRDSRNRRHLKLSHTDLSRLCRIPRGTVNSAICHTKRALQGMDSYSGKRYREYYEYITRKLQFPQTGRSTAYAEISSDFIAERPFS